MIAAEFTPTQQAAVDRHRAFRQSIARKAAELAAAKTEAKSIEPPVKALKPAAFPAEPDPPRNKAREKYSFPMIWPACAGIDLIVDEPEAEPVVTIEQIMRAVCMQFGISKSDLISLRRVGHLVYYRHVAIHLARRLTSQSYPAIARHFGNRDHSTVLHADHKITKLIVKDIRLAHDISQIMSCLGVGA